MLGERIDDAAGVDGSAKGLALLPLRTTFVASKRVEAASTRFLQIAGPWAALAGRPLDGYEIRHGETQTTASVAAALPDGLGFVDGPVLAIHVHGLFEQPEVLSALFGRPPRRSIDEAIDELADAVEEHLDIARVLEELST
jgi:adenosylcobyric acid synthase